MYQNNPKLMQAMNLLQQVRNNPTEGLQNLCKMYPDTAKTIDTMIGNGMDPKQEVYKMFSQMGVNPQMLNSFLQSVKF